MNDAERMCSAILERVAALSSADGAPSAICLAIYPSPHDFRYLRPGDPCSWEHHTAVVRATKRLLKRHGITVDLIACTAEGCAAWLNEQGLIGSTQNRAAYVATITR